MAARVGVKKNYHHPVINHSRERLQAAIDQNKVDDALKLLKTGDSVTRPLSNGELPFHYAIRLGKHELVKKMLEEIELLADAKHRDVRDLQGLTPVDHAMIGNDPKMIALVFGHLIGQAFDTALCKPINGEQYIEILSALRDVEELRSGSPANGMGQLHAAVLRGNLEEVKKLINPKDPNPYDANGMTPLHYAAFFGKEEVAVWLLEQGGAKADIVTKNGRTLLHLAAIGHPKLIGYLIDKHKMDVSATDHLGLRPLHYAMTNEDLSAAKALIQKGADPVLSSVPPSRPTLENPSLTPLDVLFASNRQRSDGRDPLALSGLHYFTFGTIVYSWILQLAGRSVIDLIGGFTLPDLFTHIIAALKLHGNSRLGYIFSHVVPIFAKDRSLFIAFAQETKWMEGIDSNGDSLPRWILGMQGLNQTATCGLIAKDTLQGLSRAWKNRTYETFRPIRNGVIHATIAAFTATKTVKVLGELYDTHLIYNVWDEYMKGKAGDAFRTSLPEEKLEQALHFGKYYQMGIPVNFDFLKDHEKILALNPSDPEQAQMILNRCDAPRTCKEELKALSEQYAPENCQEDYCASASKKVEEAYETMRKILGDNVPPHSHEDNPFGDVNPFDVDCKGLSQEACILKAGAELHNVKCSSESDICSYGKQNILKEQVLPAVRKVLDLPEKFTRQECRKSFRTLGVKFHPDKHPKGSAIQQALNQAKEIGCS